MKVFALGSLTAVSAACVVIALAWWAHDSWSTFQTGANIAQLISILSLPLAAWAIVSAKRDLVEERRISFELDTLRGLATVGIVRGSGGEEDNQGTAAAIRGLLLCLPGNDDLPLVRAAVFADPTDEALREFARLCPKDAARPDDWMNRGERYVALVDEDPQILRRGVQAAIESRVNR